MNIILLVVVIVVSVVYFHILFTQAHFSFKSFHIYYMTHPLFYCLEFLYSLSTSVCIFPRHHSAIGLNFVPLYHLCYFLLTDGATNMNGIKGLNN